jgi:hypothetical protein
MKSCETLQEELVAEFGPYVPLSRVWRRLSTFHCLSRRSRHSPSWWAWPTMFSSPATAFAGFFGFFAEGFGRVALSHPNDPHAQASLAVAFVFALIASYSTPRRWQRKPLGTSQICSQLKIVVDGPPCTGRAIAITAVATCRQGWFQGTKRCLDGSDRDTV